MATAVVAMPNPRSPGGPPAETTASTTTTSTSILPPTKSEPPPQLVRPPSPSALMFATSTQTPAPPPPPPPPPLPAAAYERSDSGDSDDKEQQQEQQAGRSRSTPMTRPISPPPKRTNSTGALPPFLAHSAILSPPSFHRPLSSNAGNVSPESRRTQSSENLPTVGSSPESSPQQHPANPAGGPSSSYPHGVTIRSSEHGLYSSTDYDVMMRPKKRHKTSRACDECRRKKIRCDATSEANVEQCSSCKRAGVTCSFSRVPMKRGPTKGLEAQYIRELEDRLVSLEYSVQTKHVPAREQSPPPPARRHEYGSSSTPPQAYNKSEPVKLNPVLASHSRNHVDRLPPIDAIQASPPMSSEKRHSTEFFRSPYHPSHRHDSISYHQNHTSPTARRESIDQPPRKMSFSAPHPVHERSASFNDALARRSSYLSLVDPPIALSSSMPGAIPIDDMAIARYYDIYHKILPVLPHDLKRLHSYLSAAPVYVRNALLHAIYALMAPDQAPSVPTSPHSQVPLLGHMDHSLKACDLLGSEAFQTDERNQSSLSRNLLHLQTLLLLALNADKRSFAAPSQNAFPMSASKERGYTTRFVGSMIGAAWGCANELKLSESSVVSRKRYHSGIESPPDILADLDSEECLARRAWWILVILDRWRSVSTSSMPLISDDKINLRDSDAVLLGESAFHLVRISCVLGHIAEVPNSTLSGEMPLNLPQIARLLNGELERVRETAERALHHDSMLNVAFWHAKLLIVSHTSDMFQSHANMYHSLLAPTQKVVDLLQSRSFTSSTPLLHHVIGFSTVILVRLTTKSDTRDDAYKMLTDFLPDRKSMPYDADKASITEGYEVIARKLLDHARAQPEVLSHHRRESESHYHDSNGAGRLAHLADLAVGEGDTGGYQPDRGYGKAKLDLWRHVGGDEGLDGLVKRHGYLSALHSLFQS